jgi:hypothetical protein
MQYSLSLATPVWIITKEERGYAEEKRRGGGQAEGIPHSGMV